MASSEITQEREISKKTFCLLYYKQVITWLLVKFNLVPRAFPFEIVRGGKRPGSFPAPQNIKKGKALGTRLRKIKD